MAYMRALPKLEVPFGGSQKMRTIFWFLYSGSSILGNVPQKRIWGMIGNWGCINI